MTWKTPVDSDVKEPQEFRVAWRCRQCGDSATTLFTNRMDLSCHTCEANSEQLLVKEFLVPSGFCVDFNEEPHNDVTSRTYVPGETPWISIDEKWRHFSKPEIGSIRVSRDAEVFVHSSGTYGNGYSLCLGCGRSHAQENEAEMAREFLTPHKKLRNSLDCVGNDNSHLIKSNIHFGYQYKTDVAELRLLDELGDPLRKNNEGHDLLSSLAVAIQFGLSSELGIEASEISPIIIPRKQENLTFDVITILDKASGGAGYSSQLAARFSDVIKSAIKHLECPSNCGSACTSCLISKDHEFDNSVLNRHLCIDYLKQLEKISVSSESSQEIQKNNFDTIDSRQDLSVFPNLIELTNEIENSVRRDGKAIIKLHKKVFLAPFSLLFLGLFIRKMNIENPGSVTFVERSINSTGYINFMGFLDLCGLDSSVKMGSDNKRGDSSYIRVQRKELDDVSIDDDFTHASEVEKMQTIGSELGKALLQNSELEHRNKDLETLTYLCREILRNVVEHSYADEMFYCAQYYPKLKKVEIAIGDLGEGIKSSLELSPHIETMQSDLEALRKALEPGTSSRAHKYTKKRSQAHYYANSGYGLYMADRICSENGSLKIASYKAAKIRNSVGEKEYSKVYFPGTILGLELKLGEISDISEKLGFIRASLDAKMKGKAPVPSIASTSIDPGEPG